MAGIQNITITRGETYEQTFEWLVNGVAQNLTGYTGEAQIRRGANSETIAATFEIEMVSATKYSLKLTWEETEAIETTGFDYSKLEKYTYDVFFAISTNRYQAQTGICFVVPSSTRPEL